MRVAYQYRLKPTYEQRCLMSSWLDLLRRQYNWLLADRFDWWEMNRTSVNACPLVCSIAAPREQPDYYSQKRSLVQLKQERPGYGGIQSQVLQDMVKRVKQAFDRFIKGDKNGKRSGKPRFKGKNRYRTFTYPQKRETQISKVWAEKPAPYRLSGRRREFVTKFTTETQRTQRGFWKTDALLRYLTFLRVYTQL
ncbi:RNA-guided endonuclease InsQ/TnpB family protein [Baaleninema simplex]|uniref:RNA-guided endonuclease InsQ/TnpB family protein n=1 Tax=Baaleninema simplex TaxID=2862350 RepID=UPI0040553662